MRLSGDWLHYTPENSPLPGALAWPIAFDSHNKAWICVSAKSGERLGLSAFDGHHWTHYPPGFAGLPDEPVYGMVVDVRDHVWLHYPFFAIYEFDGEQVVTHRPRPGGLPPLAAGVGATTVDMRGDIWLAWPSIGVFRFDGSTWHTYTCSNSGLTGDWVMALWVDSRGKVWFGAQTRERADIISYDGAEWTVHASFSMSRRRDQISVLAVDLEEQIWVGCLETWLWCFDGREWHQYTDRNSPLSSNTVYSLLVDGDNRKWIGTAGEIAVTDGHEWTCWGAFRPGTGQPPMPRDATAPGGPLANQPYVLMGSFVAEDRQGRKWMTTADGICVFVPSR
jgi:ligand-binding sensor domain-containing protein